MLCANQKFLLDFTVKVSNIQILKSFIHFLVAEEKKFSHTLNLPETKFPMKANAIQNEPNLLWNEFYEWQVRILI